MQVVAPPAVEGVTPDADTGPAVLPLANPPDVIPSRVGKEDVRPAPCLPFETPPNDGERGEIRCVFDRDQKIYILRVWLRSGDGADQGDPGHACNPHGLLGEGPGKLDEGWAEFLQPRVGDFHPSCFPGASFATRSQLVMESWRAQSKDPPSF